MSTKSSKVGVLAGLLALLSAGVADTSIPNGIFQGVKRGVKSNKQTPAEIKKERKFKKVKRRLTNKSRRINYAKAK